MAAKKKSSGKKGGWVAKATSGAHGQFAAKAKKAGMSTAAYANKVANDPNADPTTKKQAVLAKTLIGFHKKKSKKK